jgi:predicted acylesterase/phospholipase RssA/YHS domain-containing protein
LLGWEQVFPGTATALPASFEELRTPVALTAVDIESGSQVVLHHGRLLPAVRATCALPGVFPPERIAGRWLVDGAVANVLPVDVAWLADPDIVMAVRVSGPRARRLPALEWRLTRVLATVGRLLPNPATAMLSLEVLTRAAEITLERQTALCAAMTDPEILIEPELGDMGLRDFRSVDLAVAAGRRAAESALPALQRMLTTPPRRSAEARELFSRNVDPVCAMAIHPMRARATAIHDGRLYFFCSVNCRDRFRRSPSRYLDVPRLTVGATAGP